MKKQERCPWCGDDPLYIAYHDNEWGVPERDDVKLFEMLVLEGAQAGLSWITVLKRRESYRKAYDGFDPAVMANWSGRKLQSLLKDPGIIRNRLKVEAAKINAKAYLKVAHELGSFSEYIWSFVDGTPIVHRCGSLAQVPITTLESDAMSKDLKKRGFKFVGPTICYAFMQAVGMVNDHLTCCPRHKQLSQRLTAG